MNSVLLPIKTSIHIEKIIVNIAYIVLCDMKYASILFKTLGRMTNLLSGLLPYAYTILLHPVSILLLNSSRFRFFLQKLEKVTNLFEVYGICFFAKETMTLMSFKKRFLSSI